MEKDRREFLEKFVSLSSASLLLSISSIAEDTYVIEAVYGPPPGYRDKVVLPVVVPQPQIYLKEANDKLTRLDKQDDLPLNFTILIDFSIDMSKKKKSLIKFTDSSGNSVFFDTKWITEERVEITPIYDELKYGTTYTIEIDGSNAIFTTSFIPK